MFSDVDNPQLPHDITLLQNGFLGSVMFSAFSYRIGQASQDRLLLPENRVEMGARFARSQMALLSGATAATALGSLQPRTSSAKLLELIHKELQQIPEDQLRTSSRKNVRPDGEKVTLQMALGLVTSGHWRHIPMAGKETYQHLRLQQLIFAYVQVRAREQGIDLTGFTYTSIQITKNLRTKRHKDKKNTGFLDALAQGFVASLSFGPFSHSFAFCKMLVSN